MQVQALDAIGSDSNLTLISACPRASWIFNTYTFPGKQAYARRWATRAYCYLQPDDVVGSWDRLRVWREGLRQVETGGWMWFLGAECLIANPDIDWRSLGPFDGDLVIGGERWHLNYESFFLRSTPETHEFLARAAKLKAVLGTDLDAMTVLIVAETIRADIRPRRQLASLLPADAERQARPATDVYSAGDFVVQSGLWKTDGFRLIDQLTREARMAPTLETENTHRTHCVHGLGDNMTHLHFLRKLALRYPDHRFTHQALPMHVWQLSEMIEDLDNIDLKPFERVEPFSIDAWKNARLFWKEHPQARHFAEFYIDFFANLARRMGLQSPIETPEDLLFDYPALLKPTPLDAPFDVLVVNSLPASNQFTDQTSLDGMIAALAARHRVVVTRPVDVPGVCCTQSERLSVTGIGRLSMLCKTIVMVSTGSSWGTFNVWNRDSIDYRVILIDDETIGLSKNTVQARTVDDAGKLLRQRGIL